MTKMHKKIQADHPQEDGLSMTNPKFLHDKYQLTRAGVSCILND
jgi:hypothetical protein